MYKLERLLETRYQWYFYNKSNVQ